MGTLLLTGLVDDRPTPLLARTEVLSGGASLVISTPSFSSSVLVDPDVSFQSLFEVEEEINRSAPTKSCLSQYWARVHCVALAAFRCCWCCWLWRRGISAAGRSSARSRRRIARWNATSGATAFVRPSSHRLVSNRIRSVAAVVCSVRLRIEWIG